jgi:Flp pilus assembly pilin Flp
MGEAVKQRSEVGSPPQGVRPAPLADAGEVQPDGNPDGNPGWGPAVGERGQTTAEYALVLLGAAAVALLLIGWATQTDQVSRLFDFVVDQVVGRAR